MQIRAEHKVTASFFQGLWNGDAWSVSDMLILAAVSVILEESQTILKSDSVKLLLKGNLK